MTTSPKAIVKRPRHPPVHREPAADQRYQQHRQRRCQQGRTGPLHTDVDRRTQEKRKIDQHGPVAELEGGQQRGDPGHGRGREHAGIEHRARTAPLLPDEQDRRCRTANEAGGSEDQAAVAPYRRRRARRRALTETPALRQGTVIVGLTVAANVLIRISWAVSGSRRTSEWVRTSGGP